MNSQGRLSRDIVLSMPRAPVVLMPVAPFVAVVVVMAAAGSRAEVHERRGDPLGGGDDSGLRRRHEREHERKCEQRDGKDVGPFHGEHWVWIDASNRVAIIATKWNQPTDGCASAKIHVR